MDSTFMDRECDQYCEFSDKIATALDRHGVYTSYRKEFNVWMMCTTLPSEKQGRALIGRLHGKDKTAAKTLPGATLRRADGVAKILVRLDKAYDIDRTKKLETDLADFLDYSRKKEVSVEHFISSFHTRIYKIASLNTDDL